MPRENFPPDVVMRAWRNAEGKCACCGKTLSFSSQGRDDHRGAWEAHHVEGRTLPVILCIGEPENCHLNCGHEGDFGNRGITPVEHAG